jgi:predicted esterase
MKLKNIFLIILFSASCSTGIESGPKQISYNIKADIDLFLSTNDSDVEVQVLQRLKSQKVSHKAIKTLLRQRTKPIGEKRGLLTGLKFNSNGRDYSYALYYPETAPKTGPLPVVIVLHGMGGNSDVTAAKWAERLNREFIVIAPSYPMGAWWARPAEEMVLALMDQIRSQYNVDDNRVFLAGLSNGAIGVYTIGMFYPDRFAGLIPIAGSITPRFMNFLINLKNTPIYMIQGAHDPIFPIQLSRRVNQILSDMRYPVVYREHGEKGMAHGGHFLPKNEIPDLLEWIKKQKRNLNPTIVRMTRENNHLGMIHWARLKKGKNLASLELPGPESPKPNNRNGKIATLFVERKGENRFEVMGENLVEYDLFFNTETVDFDKTVVITTQKIQNQNNKLVAGEKKISYQNKLKKDLAVLLYGYKQLRDPYRLYDAKVNILLETTLVRSLQ